MPLQSSGAISLSQIQAEFGGSNPISLSEYYGAASGIPSSGTISMNQFYGKSGGASYSWSVNTTYTFTPAGQAGRFGPTLSQCQAAYSSYPFITDTELFNVTDGIQKVLLNQGTYEITAYGASGGVPYDSTGRVGRGAIVRGRITIPAAGDYIHIVVGQQGRPKATNNPDGPLTGLSYNSGGGGGSFVFYNITDSQPIMVAGGGGGGSYSGTAGLRPDANDAFSTGAPGYYVTANGTQRAQYSTTYGQGGSNLSNTSHKAGAGAGWNSSGSGGNQQCSVQSPYYVQNGFYRSYNKNTSAGTSNGLPFAGGFGGNNQAGYGSQQGGFGGGGGGTGRCGSCQAGGGGGYTGGGMPNINSNTSPTMEALAGGGSYVNSNCTNRTGLGLNSTIGDGKVEIKRVA